MFMRHRGGGVGHKATRFANDYLLSEEHAVHPYDDSSEEEGDRESMEEGEDQDMGEGVGEGADEGGQRVEQDHTMGEDGGRGGEGNGEDEDEGEIEGEDSDYDTDENDGDGEDEDLGHDDEAVIDGGGFGSL
jgi:hypothetical protein